MSCVLSAAVDERICSGPEARAAEQVAVTAHRVQKRITVVEETWRHKEVVQPPPALTVMEDDWFVLLDWPSKKSGII